MSRPYVHDEEAARKEAERIRLEETERRMTTGQPHPVQERLQQMIASILQDHRKAVALERSEPSDD
jgi:hypothetical protein